MVAAYLWPPSLGRFLHTDPSRQEVNPYVYGLANPVLHTDPSGLKAIIDFNTWVSTGGEPTRYSAKALNMVQEYRLHFFAATARHMTALTSGEYASQLTDLTIDDFLQTLAALVYVEGWGYYEETLEHEEWFEYAVIDGADLLIKEVREAGGASVGVGQIRQITALQIEEKGLLFNPFDCTGSLNFWDVTPASVGDEGYFRVIYPPPTGPPIPYPTGLPQRVWVDRSRQERVKRLFDPGWGIEYAAGNMHQAVHQPDFFSDEWNWPPDVLDGRAMSTVEKMATWHTKGVFNLKHTKPVDDGHGNEITLGEGLQHYLHLVFNTKETMRKLNLLYNDDWEAR